MLLVVIFTYAKQNRTLIFLKDKISMNEEVQIVKFKISKKLSRVINIIKFEVIQTFWIAALVVKYLPRAIDAINDQIKT